MSNLINSVTGATIFDTPPAFTTASAGLNNTTLATTAYVQTAFPASIGTGNMHLTGDETLSGVNTFNILPTNPTINAVGALQVGRPNATDAVYLGINNSTTLSINGIVQSLINFFYFCVGSNSTAGATTPANVVISQKLQAGSFTPAASATVITYSNGTINTPFTNTPAVVLTEMSTTPNATITLSNHWITSSTPTGFTANVATTTGRIINWVAIGT